MTRGWWAALAVACGAEPGSPSADPNEYDVVDEGTCWVVPPAVQVDRDLVVAEAPEGAEFLLGAEAQVEAYADRLTLTYLKDGVRYRVTYAVAQGAR